MRVGVMDDFRYTTVCAWIAVWGVRIGPVRLLYSCLHKSHSHMRERERAFTCRLLLVPPRHRLLRLTQGAIGVVEKDAPAALFVAALIARGCEGRSMDGWMDGWMVDGWMDGWVVDGWMDGCDG